MGKLLILGGGGFVGGNLMQYASSKEWMVAVADSFAASYPDAEVYTFDITDKDSVCDIIQAASPDAVVNLAAIADIDKAEQNKDLAWKVNVEGARYAAEFCAERKIKYIYFSSDAVFDGNGKNYKEDDEKKPVNYYGYTKSEGEKAVLEAYPQAIVIRISLVIGFPIVSGNSFFAGLKSKLEHGIEIACPLDEIRTPVDVYTLCESVLELAGSNLSGVLHIGGTESINRYELTKKAAAQMGLDAEYVVIQHDSDYARAPRHKKGILCVEKARDILKTPMLGIDAGINRAINQKA